jgi:DNA primase large subunit
VFVHQGFAYVPASEFVSILVGEFRARLSKGLINMTKILPRIQEDELVMPIVKNIGTQYLGPSYALRHSKDNQVTSDHVDEVRRKEILNSISS